MEDTDRAIELRAEALIDNDDAFLRDLVALRKKHQLSQEAVAVRMGVTQPTVAALERYDANPTLSTLRRYALAVGAIVEHKVVDDCAEHDLETVMLVVMGHRGYEWSKPPVAALWTSFKTATSVEVQ